MIQCVLFDFFGTLVGYTHGRTAQDFGRTHALVRAHGIEIAYADMVTAMDTIFDELQAESRVSQREFSMQDSVARFLELQDLPQDPEFSDAMAAQYVTDWSQHVEIPAGIDAYLKHLSRNFRLGLITNTHYAPMITRLLDEMGVSGLFHAVVTSVEHGRPKPHPDIFRFALEAMETTPAASVYVGDNFDADYRGATGVGMPCYLIGKHARVPAAWQIPSVFELSARLAI